MVPELSCPRCNAPTPADGKCAKCVGTTVRSTPTGAPRVGEVIGRYTIIEALDKGGMGTVYFARDNQLGTAVAIKILDADHAMNEDYRRRFLREAQIAARLRHGNIVRVLEVHIEEWDVTQGDGRCYLVMDRVAGESLQSRLERGPLTVREAVTIAKQICDALAYAHGQGIVHRDIKPANIVIDSNGHVMIVDLGLAKVIPKRQGSEYTSTGTVVGTKSYMSPEQQFGRPVDARADLFSLGLVLHEMVTGKMPWDTSSPRSPEGIAAIVGRATQLAPGDRYADAAEMRNALVLVEIGIVGAPPAPTVEAPRPEPPPAVVVAIDELEVEAPPLKMPGPPPEAPAIAVSRIPPDPTPKVRVLKVSPSPILAAPASGMAYASFFIMMLAVGPGVWRMTIDSKEKNLGIPAMATLSWIFVALTAVWVAKIALEDIKKMEGRLSGDNWAWIGIIGGVLQAVAAVALFFVE